MAPALARTLRGRNRVARTVTNWVRRTTRVPGVALRPVEVNGSPDLAITSTPAAITEGNI